MAIVTPDIIVLDTLVSGLSMILADIDTWLDSIFGELPGIDDPSYDAATLRRTQLKNFLEAGVSEDDPARAETFRIKKYLGYPNNEAQLPCWTVTLNADNE